LKYVNITIVSIVIIAILFFLTGCISIVKSTDSSGGNSQAGPATSSCTAVLDHVGTTSIDSGYPALFGVTVKGKFPSDILAIYYTDDGQVIESTYAKSVNITFKTAGNHKITVKIVSASNRNQILAQDEKVFPVRQYR
jgi:hypothetical protein